MLRHILGAPRLCNKCRRQVVPHDQERRYCHSLVNAQVSGFLLVSHIQKHRDRGIETNVCSHADDSSRAAAAGCLGCLVQWLPAEEQVLIFFWCERILIGFLCRALSSQTPFSKMTPLLIGQSDMAGDVFFILYIFNGSCPIKRNISIYS